MGWLSRVFGHSDSQRLEKLKAVQEKFSLFRELLDRHNYSLKLISHLEEKQRGGHLAYGTSIWDEFVNIREGVKETIERIIELGGTDYIPLRNQLLSISQEIEQSLMINRPIVKDDYIIPLHQLNKNKADSVGTKNANLGELKSILNLPVPEGFAISAWAYQNFIKANNLNDKVRNILKDIKIRSYHDLEVESEAIRDEVIRKPVPDDLTQAIYDAFDELASRTGKSIYALRSSAVGEDTSFSFAGQYLSFLNVRRDNLIDKYKQIIASKFTTSAIYYLMSHSLSEIDLGMGVVCMEMVDSAASGVVYTRDPLNPDESYIVINSIFGLGSYLVDGTLTPDIFHISRKDKKILYSKISPKHIQLRLGDKIDIEKQSISLHEQNRPSLDNERLALIAEYALKIEEHFGGPQDIEWAVDDSGNLFLLQTRPLSIMVSNIAFNIPKESDSMILMRGGTPICAGLGIGLVFHLSSMADIDSIPEGAVLVTTNPSPYLVAVMKKINALVTLVGGNTSHLATLARELGVPTIVGMADAKSLPANQEVTVDAANGVIYDGAHPEWIPASVSSTPNENTEADESLKKLIMPIVHLNVMHPSDPLFTPENCGTMHDILRYVHQKSMEEIFRVLKQTTGKDKIGLRLKTKIPLMINVIYLDRNYLSAKGRQWVLERDIQSSPMQALWSGILEEGWPLKEASGDLKGMMAVVGANIQHGHIPEFSENSYAFLSREYMLLNLRMGYHFSTIESLATPEPEKNYIRMQFKLGGAPLERRIRRIWLISELLRLMGFENSNQSDFLDSNIAYQSQEGTLERLRLLGRITILTKQLDMALSSDAKARWYFNEFSNKLDLKPQENKL